jgi:hypothetical protein
MCPIPHSYQYENRSNTELNPTQLRLEDEYASSLDALSMCFESSTEESDVDDGVYVDDGVHVDNGVHVDYQMWVGHQMWVDYQMWVGHQMCVNAWFIRCP